MGEFCQFQTQKTRYQPKKPKSDLKSHLQHFRPLLSRGYDCIKLDAQREGVTDCQEPWFVAFRSQGFSTWDENNLESECVKLNPDSWCAQKVCQAQWSKKGQNVFFVAFLTPHRCYNVQLKAISSSF